VGPRDTFFWLADLDSAVAEINQALRTTVEAPVTILDAEKVLSKEGRVPGEFCTDGLHLNERGYRKLDAALFDCVSQVLAGSTPPDQKP
jgi:lysophospholipase L1-like esterase